MLLSTQCDHHPSTPYAQLHAFEGGLDGLLVARASLDAFVHRLKGNPEDGACGTTGWHSGGTLSAGSGAGYGQGDLTRCVLACAMAGLEA